MHIGCPFSNHYPDISLTNTWLDHDTSYATAVAIGHLLFLFRTRVQRRCSEQIPPNWKDGIVPTYEVPCERYIHLLIFLLNSGLHYSKPGVHTEVNKVNRCNCPSLPVKRWSLTIPQWIGWTIRNSITMDPNQPPIDYYAVLGVSPVANFAQTRASCERYLNYWHQELKNGTPEAGEVIHQV